MINIAIEGTTRRIGKAQGYLGLAIRDDIIPDYGPVMISAWELTPDEIEQINKGASIHLYVLGTQHAPVRLVIGTLPENSNA